MFLKEMYGFFLCLILSNKYEIGNAMHTKYSRAASSSGGSRTTSSELQGKAKAAFHQLQFEQALSYCNQAIEMNANKVSYFILRAKILCKLKDYESALTDLRKAILMEPNQKFARTLLCFVLLKLGRLDEAKENIQHIDNYRLGTLGNEFLYKDQFEEAMFFYNAGIERNPSDPWLLRLRGNCLFKMQKFNESIIDLKKAFQSAPNEVDTQNFLIEVLFLSGRVKEALKEMEQMDHVRIGIVGHKMFLEGKFEEAVLSFTEAIKKDANRAWYYKSRGMCYEKMGNLDAALSDFWEALKINPNVDDNRVLLCETLLELGRIEEMKEVIRSANDKAFTWLFRLGRKFCLQNEYEKAIRLFTALIELNPHQTDYYIERARCHREMGNVQEAKVDLESLIKLAPSRITDPVHLIEFLVEFEEYNTAKSVIRDINVLELTEEDHDILEKICQKITCNEKERTLPAPSMNSTSPSENTALAAEDETAEGIPSEINV